MSETIKITSHVGVAAAVPHLLGFTPSESLVLVALQPPRDRIAFCIRVDLVPAMPEQLADEVVRRVRAAGFSRGIAVIYTDDNGEPRPRINVVDALAERLPLRDALLVRDDRVWSYLCEDATCCPAEGRLLAGNDEAFALAAANALRGRALAPSRQEMLAWIAQPEPAITTEMLSALAAVNKVVADLSGEERLDEFSRLIARCLERLDDPRRDLAPGAVAVLVGLLEDARVRDSFISRIAATDDLTWWRLIEELVRKTPLGHDAEACCVLAIKAYLDGDGVTAAAALDRVLATAPEHPLGNLIQDLLTQAVHPDEVRVQLLSPFDEPAVRDN